MTDRELGECAYTICTTCGLPGAYGNHPITHVCLCPVPNHARDRIAELEARLAAINDLTTACECVPCMRIRTEVKAALSGKG